MERFPAHDQEFKAIICKYSECIDIEKDSKEVRFLNYQIRQNFVTNTTILQYPVVQLISKYKNNKSKDEKLNNVLNKMLVYDTDSETPNKPTNKSLLAKYVIKISL